MRIVSTGFLMFLTFILSCSGSQKSAVTEEDSVTEEERTLVEEGVEFVRTCNSSEDHRFSVSGTACRILPDNNQIFGYIMDSNDQTIMHVMLRTFKPGIYRTDDPNPNEDPNLMDDTMGDVIWSSPCPGRAGDSPSPCTLELIEATFDPESENNDVLVGSNLHFRVSCPSELLFKASDFTVKSAQTPQDFEFSASECTIIGAP
ncbi:MAG: hypothetical protein JXX14_06630 [Deltaproteobacteria bacterium]|nr:hypothetical protein [Deltaproteobacteria bacterium]